MFPLIALIGRPNVGKSTIFNRLIHQKKAVISEIPGTTRDRIYGTCNLNGEKYILVDTGGISKIVDNDSIEIGIQDQTEIAINEANIIVLILDGQTGLFPDDKLILKKLYKSGKKFFVIINKVDSPNIQNDIDANFRKLGHSYICVSGIHAVGFGDLHTEINEAAKDLDDIKQLGIANPSDIVVSVIGKPNVGKSSIVNALTGEKISIVSEQAGTTRDSVDTNITHKDNNIKIVDTAGLRRRSKIDSSIEFYSYLRALKSLQRSDIAILVRDATESVSHFEKTIIQQIDDFKKGCVIVVNKWDLIDKDTHTMAEYTKYMRRALPFCKWIPIIYTSAVTNKRLTDVLDQVIKINCERKKEIKTSLLNEILEDAKMAHQPSALNSKKKHPKMYFIRQTNTKPPTFNISVNDKSIFHSSYLRYFEKRLREIFSFEGTPIKLILQNKPGRHKK